MPVAESTWPRMTAAPGWPGAGPYLYQPVRSWSPSGGTWTVPSAFLPTSMTGALTPMAGMRMRTGTDRTSACTCGSRAGAGTAVVTDAGMPVAPASADRPSASANAATLALPAHTAAAAAAAASARRPGGAGRPPAPGREQAAHRRGERRRAAAARPRQCAAARAPAGGGGAHRDRRAGAGGRGARRRRRRRGRRRRGRRRRRPRSRGLARRGRRRRRPRGRGLGRRGSRGLAGAARRRGSRGGLARRRGVALHGGLAAGAVLRGRGGAGGQQAERAGQFGCGHLDAEHADRDGVVARLQRHLVVADVDQAAVAVAAAAEDGGAGRRRAQAYRRRRRDRKREGAVLSGHIVSSSIFQAWRFRRSGGEPRITCGVFGDITGESPARHLAHGGPPSPAAARSRCPGRAAAPVRGLVLLLGGLAAAAVLVGRGVAR